MIPILHSPGLMMPGQLGPITLDLVYDLRAALTYSMSCAGTPSVITTINSTSAYIASKMASLAKGAGT